MRGCHLHLKVRHHMALEPVSPSMTLAAVSEPPPWFHGNSGDLSTKHSVSA